MKRIDLLDDEITELWKYPVYDGITNLKRYNSANKKILWILKEPNKEKAREIWNHREFHNNDVSAYKKWKNTYQKIIYISYGILNSIYRYIDIPYYDFNASTINGKNVLQDIAIININKNGGKSFSQQKVINKCYDLHKEFILKQIAVVNADIIINASRVFKLYEDLSNERSVELKKTNMQYKIHKKKIIINCYHPNARIDEELYCNSILKVIKSKG